MQQNPLMPLVFEAIALRKCLDAVYNGGTVRLAPHLLFTRHDELYLAAATLIRDGQPPREPKLGTFKLTGLKELALSQDQFRPLPGYDPAGPPAPAETLFALELEPDERLMSLNA
ncbi:MAG: hypothetical protein JWO25_2454 [Alphaproteobacteria bacterium]|nr:hypothetical protein [Alphaproteobacteria bacterium]